MCGIAGIILGKPDGQQRELVKAMTAALTHRGPNGDGFWQDGEGRYFLGHRRLSIIDLSAASNQPFQYGQYVMVYNGEIYNFPEIRLELERKGYKFFTTGDAEVIPAAFDCWGWECLHRFDGMFAFALLDAQAQKLWLARDRFGEKPLFFNIDHRNDGHLERLSFASEMKALWAGGIRRQINPKMLLNYLSLGYVQNPADKTETFFENLKCLPPGHLLEVDLGAMGYAMHRWFDPAKQIRLAENLEGRDEGAIAEQFRDLFFQSVKRRLRSDVPVGTSLSGGLDSSSIVAAIDALKMGGNLPDGWANVCFSAIFPGFEKDEDHWGRAVTGSFGLNRYTVEPTAGELLRHFSDMMAHQEEPVQSSSALAQYLVYKAAKEKGITVLLDGQGADEVLAGYARYSHWYLQQLWRSGSKDFAIEKKQLKANGMLEHWGPANYVSAWFPHRTAGLLQQRALRQQQRFPFCPDFFEAFSNANSLVKPVVRQLEDILYFNTFGHGLEELLRYADRNSMAHGREVRLPFLQHELVAFIFSLPPHFKIRQGFGKWILRKAMERYLPADLVWRKGKVGFEPPQKQWMGNAAMLSGIMESRKKLVEAGIILSSELKRPLSDQGAHHLNSHDWRYLCAASILGKG